LFTNLLINKMKFKQLLLTILIIACTRCQLFDVVNQELEKMIKTGNNNQNTNSDQMSLLQNKENVLTQGSQATEANNRIAQPFTPSNSMPINTTPMPQQNPQPVNMEEKKESSIRVIQDTKAEPLPANRTKDDIDVLKKDVQALIQTNEKLLEKFKNMTGNDNKDKPSGSSSNIVSFIQKYDKDVNNLQDKLKTNKNEIETTLNEKGKEFERLYNRANSKFDDIHKKVETVNRKLDHIKNESLGKIKNLRENFKVSNLEVQEKLTAAEANINKLDTNEIDLPTFKVTKKEVEFKKDAKFVFDGEFVTLSEIMKEAKLFEEFVKKCGNNFEKCKPVSDEVLQEQEKTQKVILDSLRDLREQTNRILLGRQKRLR
jgi:hypothetical protein